MTRPMSYRCQLPGKNCTTCIFSERIPAIKNLKATEPLLAPIAYLCEYSGKIESPNCLGLSHSEVLEKLKEFGSDIVSENGICEHYERK